MAEKAKQGMKATEASASWKVVDQAVRACCGRRWLWRCVTRRVPPQPYIAAAAQSRSAFKAAMAAYEPPFGEPDHRKCAPRSPITSSVCAPAWPLANLPLPAGRSGP